MENFKQPLPYNCVIFSLTDGVYTLLTDMSIPGKPSDISKHRGKIHDDLKV